MMTKTAPPVDVSELLPRLELVLAREMPAWTQPVHVAALDEVARADPQRWRVRETDTRPLTRATVSALLGGRGWVDVVVCAGASSPVVLLSTGGAACPLPAPSTAAVEGRLCGVLVRRTSLDVVDA